MFMKHLIRRVFGPYYTVKETHSTEYKGSWRSGLYDGRGVLTYANGSHYEGSFSNGLRDGKGIYHSSTGYIFEGFWKFGKSVGQCKINYKNGDYYEGCNKNGLRHGFGTLHEKKTERIYEGTWHSGKLCGHVKVQTKSWIFDGIMPDQDGKTTGKLLYADGSSYEGKLLNYQRYGAGTYVSKQGEKIQGSWLNEMDVKCARKLDNDGIVWRGTLKNFQPDGFMNVKLPNGHNYDGVFRQGDLLRVISVNNQSKSTDAYRIH